MSDTTFRDAISTLLVEVFDGPPGESAYILNPGDPGLLRQLESVDAKTASTRPMPGHTTVAAHVEHVWYGMSLLVRWIEGEANPWQTADWNASWKKTKVDEAQWRDVRDRLRDAAEQWKRAFPQRNDWEPVAAAGAVASVAHTAYHLGAIRQILAAADAYKPVR